MTEPYSKVNRGNKICIYRLSTIRTKPSLISMMACAADLFQYCEAAKGERFLSDIRLYIPKCHRLCDVDVDTVGFGGVGNRGSDVWDGEPEGVYVPTHMPAQIICLSDSCEVFVAGARYEERLSPFAVRKNEIDVVQYGSDDTKTHRKIKHILGQKQADKVGRLLVSELYTVGAGGWSGFPPHKHDTDRLPDETRHDEVYNFRFKPEPGFGMQVLEPVKTQR